MICVLLNLFFLSKLDFCLTLRFKSQILNLDFVCLQGAKNCELWNYLNLKNPLKIKSYFPSDFKSWLQRPISHNHSIAFSCLFTSSWISSIAFYSSFVSIQSYITIMTIFPFQIIPHLSFNSCYSMPCVTIWWKKDSFFLYSSSCSSLTSQMMRIQKVRRNWMYKFLNELNYKD